MPVSHPRQVRNALRDAYDKNKSEKIRGDAYRRGGNKSPLTIYQEPRSPLFPTCHETTRVARAFIGEQKPSPPGPRIQTGQL